MRLSVCRMRGAGSVLLASRALLLLSVVELMTVTVVMTMPGTTSSPSNPTTGSTASSTSTDEVSVSHVTTGDTDTTSSTSTDEVSVSDISTDSTASSISTDEVSVSHVTTGDTNTTSSTSTDEVSVSDISTDSTASSISTDEVSVSHVTTGDTNTASSTSTDEVSVSDTTTGDTATSNSTDEVSVSHVTTGDTNTASSTSTDEVSVSDTTTGDTATSNSTDEVSVSDVSTGDTATIDTTTAPTTATITTDVMSVSDTTTAADTITAEATSVPLTPWMPVCNEPSEHGCGNGVCVPPSQVCDGYNDCGDSTAGSDEQCQFDIECTVVAWGVLTACGDRNEWVGAASTLEANGLATEFFFHAPADPSWGYLTEISVSSALIDLQSAGLTSATIFINVGRQSAPANTVRISTDRAVVDGFFETFPRDALAVGPGESIRVTVRYDDRVAAGRAPFVVAGNCTGCVRLRFGRLRPGCQHDDTGCLPAFYAFKDKVARVALDTPGQVCVLPSQVEHLTGEYDACVGPPEFAFVTESPTSFPGDRVELRCMAEGPLLWRVDWRDGNGENRASGLGSASLEVLVSDAPQRFDCVLDEDVTTAQSVTVSSWPTACNDLRSQLDVHVQSPCLATQRLTGDPLSSDPDRPAFRFEPAGSAAVVYRFSADPPWSGPLLPLLLEIRQSRPRGRRYIDRDELYTKTYDSVHDVPAEGTVVLDLDPPVSKEADYGWEVTVVAPADRRVSAESSRPPAAAALEAVSCSSDANDTAACADFLAAWSRAQADFLEAGCGQSGDPRLQAYRICKGVAAGELVIITAPESVHIALAESNGLLDSRTTLTCNIENALEYKWYKVGPLPGRQLIKSGPGLTIHVDASSSPDDQGSYVCVGRGGNDGDANAETEPALVTIQGFSAFTMTAQMSLADWQLTPNLTDPRSPEHQQLRAEFTNISLPSSGQFLLELIDLSFSSGDVVVEGVLYARDTGTQNTETLASLLQSVVGARMRYTNGSVVLLNLVNCPMGQIRGIEGNLTFPETTIGQTAESEERCPESTFRAGTARATRECVGDMRRPAAWMSAVSQPCYDDDSIVLQKLAQVEVTPENVELVARAAARFTSNQSEVNGSSVVAAADILWNIVDADSPSSEVAEVVVEIVNNILQVDEEELEDFSSTSLILQATEAYITALQLSGEGANLTVVESDLAVAAVSLPAEALRRGLGFAALPPSSGPDPGGPAPPEGGEEKSSDVSVYYDAGSVPVDEVTAFVKLPPAVEAFTSPGGQIPISFFFYSNDKLFRSPSLREAARPEEGFRRAVGGSVIAATMEGARVENLHMGSPVTTSFNLPVDVAGPNETLGDSQCVFWDFRLNGGFGDWTGDGCWREPNSSRYRPVCHCDHLTSFAVIVDIYGNKEADRILTTISKIGCGVSSAALVITILTYLAIRKLRRKQPQQILLNLCVALLCLYIVFLAGIEAKGAGVACALVAALIHYFTLASVAWMAVEAANMYLLFVRVYNANVRRFMLKASAVGWGLPLVVVAVNAAVDHTNYHDEHTKHCFLRIDNALYFGLILPIGLAMLFNGVVFALVMRQLTCARRSLVTAKDRSRRAEFARRLSNAVCISTLMGLTWAFGLLSLIQAAALTFQYLFCVFNSLQGLLIFLLFCARQTEVRRAWRGWLCRGGEVGGTVCCRRRPGAADARAGSSQPISSQALSTLAATGTTSAGTSST